MNATQILESIRLYLWEHKGISQSLIYEEVSLTNFGFTTEEWQKICQDWNETFELGNLCWPIWPKPAGEMSELINFIVLEQARRKIVRVWEYEKIYQTADNTFWDYRSLEDKTFEVKKRFADDENEFFEVYYLPNLVLVFCKNTMQKAFEFSHIRRAAHLVLLLDKFFLFGEACYLDIYNAETFVIYNQSGEVYPLKMQYMKMSRSLIEYNNGLLKIGRSYYELGDDVVRPIGEVEYKRKKLPNLSLSCGWEFADPIIAKQLK